MHACRDYILDLLEGGRKLIVFAHHKSVLDSVCECLHSKVSRQGEAVMLSEKKTSCKFFLLKRKNAQTH